MDPQFTPSVGRPAIRVTASITGAVLVALALSGSAMGAMYLRMSLSPASPQVGETAQLEVQTGVQAGTGAHCLDDAGASFTPMRSEDWSTPLGRGLQAGDLAAAAIGPNDQRLDVPLKLRPSDTSVWDGDVLFPTPGEWTIHMVHPSWSDESCAGALLHVAVRSAGVNQPFVPLAGAAIVVTIAAAAAAWSQRRRIRSGSGLH
jgi:hypothetical protein